MQGFTVHELKESLKTSARRGIALDIDETLAATNVAWFARCIELFGNPEGLTVQALVAQYNPAWHNEEAQMWMHAQRTAPEAQDGLPLIPGALEGVKTVPPNTWVAYLTVRPRTVNSNTIAWLRECGFPDLPIVAKPEDIPFEDGNKWKAEALHHLWPEVTGIVDDNPKVPQFAGKHYPGDIFLFGKDCTEPTYEWAIPCKHWPNVVETITRKRSNKGIVT